MLKTYKLLSLLLDYPDQTVETVLDSAREEIRKENLIPSGLEQQLSCFLDNCASLTLSDWQMIYVQQFDYSRTVNLYLFDYVYGDSRQRGQAMVDLKEMYARGGWQMVPDELPDYLPLFLEYLSTLSSGPEAVELLAPLAPILRKMEERLTEENNFYRYLFRVLLGLAESSREKASVGGNADRITKPRL